MTPTVDLIAAELRKHVDLILWEESEPTQTDFPGTSRQDSGGLTCTCGQWSAPRDEETGTRPRKAYNVHCAEMIQRAITTQETVDVLTAINERLILPRMGLSVLREMAKDIVTLQSAAAILTVLLAPDHRWTGEPQHPETTR